jgi:hypothetical protein
LTVDPKARSTNSDKFRTCRFLGLAGCAILLVCFVGTSSFSILRVYAQEQDNFEFGYEDGDDGYFNALNSITARLSNGNVTSISADPDFSSILIVVATNSSDGDLRLVLPRVAIDAKNGTEDAVFTVVVNSAEVAYDEVRTNETERELQIAIPGGTEQVEIIGTQVIPEFPFVVALIAAAMTGLVIATKSKILKFCRP